MYINGNIQNPDCSVPRKDEDACKALLGSLAGPQKRDTVTGVTTEQHLMFAVLCALVISSYMSQSVGRAWMAAACPFAGAICARADKIRLLYPLPVINVNFKVFLILSTDIVDASTWQCSRPGRVGL